MHLLNIYKTPIRWTDLDAYGHLNNAVFLDFMSEARAELLVPLLTPETHYQFLVARAECDYKKAFFYPDVVMVKQYCSEIGNSSFSLQYEFFSGQTPDILHAQGMVKMVTYNPTLKKPTRIPPDVLQLLTP